MSHLLSVAAGAATSALFVHERRARRSAERLAAALLETLLNAIDANDPQTGAHVRRVARYALILGEAADLAPAEQKSVERVALFHDIGKIHEALFDIIHDNDDALTPEERRAIDTHPVRGAKVLAPLDSFYPDLAEGVLAHHERWDGTGYPRRLRGRDIPFAARVVTIADTFDAITHARRYQAGRSSGHAAQVIARGRGAQFDPELTDLFLCPPVLDAVRDVMREGLPARRPSRRPARGERRGEKEERAAAPDVSFRWRSAVPAPPPPGPAPTELPG